MKNSKKFLCFIMAFSLILIPISVNAQELQNNNYVILGGEAFGIKMYSEGVMVVKCDEKNAVDGIDEKDVILYANDEYVESTEKLASIVEKSRGNPIKFKIRSNNKITEKIISPKLSADGSFKLGIWVKDSAAGLGTITFYNENNMSFCGLGHGICETDTGEIIPLHTGDAEFAHITSVTKNENGNVGCLNGYFTDRRIGETVINCKMGIYGKIDSPIPQKDKIQIANVDEIENGSAYIITTIDGEEPCKYEVEIKKIRKQEDTQNLIIEVTDKDLINKTGGIVQGMSGSPIVQNGKLVGAVTHVMIDNKRMGYGIFAEKMYNMADKIETQKMVA